MQQPTAASDPHDAVSRATLKSPQVIAAGQAVRSALTLTKSGRATVPGQLTIAPWLGSPNGTTEEFLFIQSLDAGGRRKARVLAHDANLQEAEVKYAETVLMVYVQILTHLTKLAAAEREHALAIQIENNLLASLKIIEAQVNAGAKPGSDADLARVIWNEARIATNLAVERITAQRASLKVYGIEFDGTSTETSIPNPNALVETKLLERRAAVSASKLGTDIRAIAATGRPDVSMVVRSQNFTRQFTPNDRGIAVQLSIPIDHGSIRANAETLTSQLSTIDSRLKDDVSKQQSQRTTLYANITSFDNAIASSVQSVIAPLRDYVARMQRAYLAGTVNVMAYVDAQRSLHNAEHRLVTLRDQRDLATLQLVDQCGMLPNTLLSANKQTDRK